MGTHRRECLDVDRGEHLAGDRGVGADGRREVVGRRQRDVVVAVEVGFESLRLAAMMPTATTMGLHRQRAEEQALVDPHGLKATDGPPPAIVGGDSMAGGGPSGLQSGVRAEALSAPDRPCPPGGGDRRVAVSGNQVRGDGHLVDHHHRAGVLGWSATRSLVDHDPTVLDQLAAPHSPGLGSLDRAVDAIGGK